MHKENVNAPIKLPTYNMQHGILLINKGTLDSLKQKHLEGKPAHESVLLRDIPEDIHPVKFEIISVESIRKTAIKTKGGSGTIRCGCC